MEAIAQEMFFLNLSRRQRQIIDILYQQGSASVEQVRERLPNPPSYSAVRAMLKLLEERGFVKHEEKGLRYVYMPTVDRTSARRSVVRHLLGTFFNGSTEQAVATLLDISSSKLSREEFDRLARLIKKARKDGL